MLRAISSCVAAGAVLALSACSQSFSNPTLPVPTQAPAAAPTLAPGPTQLQLFQKKINHIVVIYQENWSFDSLYGKFPGANGYNNAIISQVDASGKAITSLPPVIKGGKPDPAFNPQPTAVAPFDISTYVAVNGTTADPNHNFFLQQYQIDGGKMDRYLAIPPGDPANGSATGGLPFGYYDATNLPEGQIAQQYTLADNFHQSMFGGSFINNFALWSGGVPAVFTGGAPPAGIIEQFDAAGNPIQLGGPEGRVTPALPPYNNYYIVNTSFTTQYPQFSAGSSLNIVPPQTMPDLGSQLSAAGVSWTWFSGGLANALAGKPDPTFQPHHQAPLFFANYAPGKPAAANVKDSSLMAAQIASGTLPQVTILKPLGLYNEHPGYTNLICGQTYVSNIISQIQMSPIWKDTMILVLYDEAGGHYDHVPPLSVDLWGPSTRVPAIMISPFMKRNFVDHTNYETESIVSTISARFGLTPLTPRVAQAATFVNAFDFTQPTPQAFGRHGLLDVPACPITVPPTGKKVVTEIDE